MKRINYHDSFKRINHSLKHHNSSKKSGLIPCFNCGVDVDTSNNKIICKKCLAKFDAQEKLIALFFRKFDDFHNAVSIAADNPIKDSPKWNKDILVLKRQLSQLLKKV